MAGKKKAESKDKEDNGLSEEDNREQMLAEFFKNANKNFGAGTAFYPEDDKFKVIPRISTGIFPLDYSIGGGIPVGRISLFYGHKSTSKTTNILRAIGNAQKLCSNCWTPLLANSNKGSCSCGINRKVVTLWLDVEGAWDEKWSSNFVSLDETLIVSRPGSAEQTIDLAHAALQSAVDIIVIDSIAFMTPQAEQDRSSSEDTMALQARQMGKGIRRFVATTNEVGKDSGRRPTIIMTNQIRLKVGLVFGNPETLPGGYAAGFATSLEIKTSHGKYVMDEITGKPISVENKAVIEKNKVGPPKIETAWDVCMMKTDVKNVGEIMDESWVFEMGERVGLIKVAPQRIECNGATYRGRSLLEKHWMDNKEDYTLFKNQLMPILLAV